MSLVDLQRCFPFRALRGFFLEQRRQFGSVSQEIRIYARVMLVNVGVGNMLKRYAKHMSRCDTVAAEHFQVELEYPAQIDAVPLPVAARPRRRPYNDFFGRANIDKYSAVTIDTTIRIGFQSDLWPDAVKHGTKLIGEQARGEAVSHETFGCQVIQPGHIESTQSQCQ